MTQSNPALQLFRDLFDDLRDPNFVWQLVALAACVGVAVALLARRLVPSVGSIPAVRRPWCQWNRSASGATRPVTITVSP